MKEGIINVNKPAGWTSQDVCAKLRGRLHIKRIGHTGTLDPMATGVLPVCTGKATRLIEYYDRDFKTYHAGMKLGITTDTLDIWGAVTEEKDVSQVTEESVRKAFADYTGLVYQVPPKYSAIRVNGKRAYDLAREGKEFELRKRPITIASNTITMLDLSTGQIEFDVTCSKGTYIRTICDDIGAALGCGGVMTSLERTASGFFRIEDACDIRELVEKSDEEVDRLVIPADETLTELGKVMLNDNRVIAFINGNTSGTGFRIISPSNFTVGKASAIAEDGKSNIGGETGKADGMIYRVYGKGEFLGTGAIEKGVLVPAKVIYNR